MVRTSEVIHLVPIIYFTPSLFFRFLVRNRLFGDIFQTYLVKLPCTWKIGNSLPKIHSQFNQWLTWMRFKIDNLFTSILFSFNTNNCGLCEFSGECTDIRRLIFIHRRRHENGPKAVFIYKYVIRYRTIIDKWFLNEFSWFTHHYHHQHHSLISKAQLTFTRG